MSSYTQADNQMLVPAYEERPHALCLMRYMSHRTVQSNHNRYILITSDNYPLLNRVVITFELYNDLEPKVARSGGSQ